MIVTISMSLQVRQQKIILSINNQKLSALTDNVKDNTMNNNISNFAINATKYLIKSQCHQIIMGS